MKNSSDTGTTTDQPFQPLAKMITPEEDDHLREILKRCPPSTYEAARRFRVTGDVRQVPAIVFGIIERFTESELRPKLRKPHDGLMLGEDLGLDSLTMMEIVLLVEDVLTISIKNDELRHLRTLGDVRQFVEGKLHPQPDLEQP